MIEQPTQPSEQISPLARLFQMARQQGYITFDQILVVWPDPEGALDQLDRLFGALIAAGIPFGDKSGFEYIDDVDEGGKRR